MIIVSGILKTMLPLAVGHVHSLPWAARFSFFLVRSVGFCELITAFALLFPILRHARTVVVPVVLYLLATVQFLAMLWHVWAQQWQYVPINVLLAVGAWLIANGRRSARAQQLS